jgi:hypothetical protein
MILLCFWLNIYIDIHNIFFALSGTPCQEVTVAVEASWNVMAHAHKPDFVFRRNIRVHLNRRGCQFSRLLAADMCAPAVVMLDTPCSKVVWRVLATHSIRQFHLHFSSRASPCAITFQLESSSKASPILITTLVGEERKFELQPLCLWRKTNVALSVCWVRSHNPAQT